MIFKEKGVHHFSEEKSNNLRFQVCERFLAQRGILGGHREGERGSLCPPAGKGGFYEKKKKTTSQGGPKGQEEGGAQKKKKELFAPLKEGRGCPWKRTSCGRGG